MVKIGDSELDPVCTLALTLVCCVNLDSILDVSIPQYPHFTNGVSK